MLDAKHQTNRMAAQHTVRTRVRKNKNDIEIAKKRTFARQIHLHSEGNAHNKTIKNHRYLKYDASVYEEHGIYLSLM